MSPRFPLALLLSTILVVLTVLPAAARPVLAPVAEAHDVLPATAVDRFEADRMDADAALSEDLDRERQGMPPRFAIPQETFIAPDTHGTWEELAGGNLVWRVRIEAPGAVSLNLGFTSFELPPASHLNLYPTDGSLAPVSFTTADNKDHRQLWTPIVETDDLMVEVVLPVKERWNLDLELTSVNVGYRRFGELASDLMGLKQGTCNNDVVCPIGDGWRDDIQSVGAISTGGSAFCTGFMVNNTAQDETPYFMTANHCGINSGNAASLVVYWNFESPNCGDLNGGSLADFQTGSTFRSAYSASDFTLVELDDLPDAASEVAYAGWDRGSQDATMAVAIHHPSGDEKAISFEYDATTTTSYLNNAVPGDGTHIRVIDWDSGTTEPGSSGSPLFDQNHRVIGQLHGGYAACGNDDSDWYGRISVSWNGGGTAATRLSNWLDPLGTGAQTVDLLAPYASGLGTSPSTILDASGDVGGPFSPTSAVYTLTNRNDTGSISYSVTADQGWIDVSSAGGVIAAGASVNVTVSLNASATGLSAGLYTGVVSIVNTTDGIGDTQRAVRLAVGSPTSIHAWSFDTDPGWDTQGAWDFGTPAGSGGSAHGNADPSSGYTGSNVYGFNLGGDYTNNMPETHLTSTAIDCSSLSGATLKFRRWLNVEQPAYDHAYVRVSNDNINWTTVWTNTGEVTDNSWNAVEYDISAVADGQATVYLRWTMGATDGSWLYSGWNVDDVEIWGFNNTAADAPHIADVLTLAVAPNPFNPMTEVRFQLPRDARARLGVYDLRGQLVRMLTDTDLPAGEHLARWDGTDAAGRAAGSGSYLFRLEADGQTQVRKALLVR